MSSKNRAPAFRFVPAAVVSYARGTFEQLEFFRGQLENQLHCLDTIDYKHGGLTAYVLRAATEVHPDLQNLKTTKLRNHASTIVRTNMRE